MRGINDRDMKTVTECCRGVEGSEFNMGWAVAVQGRSGLWLWRGGVGCGCRGVKWVMAGCGGAERWKGGL